MVLTLRAALAAGFFTTCGGQTPLLHPGGLPTFGPILRDELWRRAGEEAEALGESGYTSNQKYTCSSGTWGDGPQCNQWDQGHSPCWPSAMTISASWDTELMARWSKEMAQEFGLPNRGQLAPGVNLARYAWNGRLGEYMAGEDPFFGAKMVSAMVTAYRQVPSPPLQTVKHFIPNTIEKDRMSMTEVVDERTLFEVYYPPFQAAVEAGVSGVMCSYNLLNCTSGRCNAGTAYACANDDILNKHLKDEMGFKGIVISDWDATKCQPKAAKSGGCSAGSYIENDFAAEAGLDLEMPACMTFSGGVTKRAKEKAQRMIWAYMVQNRSFDHTRTGRNRGWYAETGVQRRLGEKSLDEDEEDEFCCWWPRKSQGGDACSACKSKDRTASPEHCVTASSAGTWCRGEKAVEVPTTTTEKPKHAWKPWTPKPWTPWKPTKAPEHHRQHQHHAWTPPAWKPPAAEPKDRTDYSKLPVQFPPLCPDVGGENYKSECKLALADRIIAESTVVLKNQGGVLPLSKAAKVALVGSQACASDPLAIGGGSGWNGMACQQVPKVNVQKGIEGLQDGPHLACPNNGADNAEAEDADVVLAVVVPAKASEGQDRPTLQLEDEDVEIIKKYTALGKKVVVAMNAPGPMITSTWDENVTALVVSWLPGVQNGRGIAIALYNEGYEASGRLPFTFPKCSTAECSKADELASVALGDEIANHGEESIRVFKDKALIGYRWYHAHEKPVSYPFGFGLFAYGSADVRYTAANARVDLLGAHVSVQLSHFGPRAGRDVPQLYVKFPKVPGDSASRPEWVLKGFEKVLVRPRVSSTATFDIAVRDLSWWDDTPGQSRWVCPSGNFNACVGANAQDAISRNGACTSFSLICPAGTAAEPGAVYEPYPEWKKDHLSFLRRRVLREFDLARIRAAASSWSPASPVAAISVATAFCMAAAVAVVFRRSRRRSESNNVHVQLPLWAGETDGQTVE